MVDPNRVFSDRIAIAEAVIDNYVQFCLLSSLLSPSCFFCSFISILVTW